MTPKELFLDDSEERDAKNKPPRYQRNKDHNLTKKS